MKIADFGLAKIGYEFKGQTMCGFVVIIIF
jgi:hypothetical protein